MKKPAVIILECFVIGEKPIKTGTHVEVEQHPNLSAYFFIYDEAGKELGIFHKSVVQLQPDEDEMLARSAGGEAVRS